MPINHIHMENVTIYVHLWRHGRGEGVHMSFRVWQTLHQVLDSVSSPYMSSPLEQLLTMQPLGASSCGINKSKRSVNVCEAIMGTVVT